MTTTAPAIRVGRLPVSFRSHGLDMIRQLIHVPIGTMVDATVTVAKVQRHGARATLIVTGDDDTTAAVRVDADRMRTFAHRLPQGQTITLRGTVDRLDGGMPVIDLRAIAPTT